MQWHTLGELNDIISGYNAEVTLVYVNGKRRKTTRRDFTKSELNTIVLNIFATGVNMYQIHLNNLNKKIGGINNGKINI